MKPAIRIEKLETLNDSALALLNEYYEAVDVVQRDTPAEVKCFLREAASGIWLAYDDKASRRWLRIRARLQPCRNHL